MQDLIRSDTFCLKTHAPSEIQQNFRDFFDWKDVKLKITEKLLYVWRSAYISDDKTRNADNYGKAFDCFYLISRKDLECSEKIIINVW